MVYIMDIHVDGGCRRNGYHDAIGAAAAILKPKYGKRYWSKTQRLCDYPSPTNQRAEIIGIILGLKWALEKYDELDSNPHLDLTIWSDSRYAVNCMNDWIYKWVRNGWINARGEAVANRDLIKEASDLDDRVKELGSVEYVWIPREENRLADKHCNEELDKMEDES
jgi:ribonuclease HI